MTPKKYRIHAISNNNQLLKDNLLKSLNNEKNVEYEITNNSDNSFSNVRNWLNFVLNKYYSKSINKVDFICFAHQDIIIHDNFFKYFEKIHSQLKNENIGLIGLAGINSKGQTFSFMKDSDMFKFNGYFEPQEVDSVDEFFFIIPGKVIDNLQIQFANINSWHAYAAELAIILKNHNYKTYVYPIYIEHNSIRTNNHGLLKTHIQIYQTYKVKLRTLVGVIKDYSKYEKLKRRIREYYSANIKFQFSSSLIKKIKSFILDDLRFKFSIQRKLNLLYKGNICFIYFSNFHDLHSKDVRLSLERAQIHFISVLSDDKEIWNMNFSIYDKIIILGYQNRINKSFKIGNYQIIKNHNFHLLKKLALIE